MRIPLLLSLLALAFVARGDEEVAQVSESLTPEQEALVSEGAASYPFQAEVNRLMDIIIRSLYKDRDIFIRELVSNCADAIDKYRYQTLSTGKPVNENEFQIRVKFDRDAKTLSVQDSGIGMTKDDLIKNLGTVAKSGTTEFVEAALKGGKDGKPGINLIGQFGVGFYSVYLVADKVTVISKHDDDKQHIWQSAADGSFTVAEDPRGTTIPRGTQVILQMKEDATEFLHEEELSKLITRYSQFIAYPISIWSKKTVTEEVPVEEEAPVEKEKEETDDLQVSEDEDEETAKPKTKTVSKEVNEWKVLNTAKPLWTRNAKDISDEEYVEFYKSFTKDTNGYLTKIHFNAEGELSFRSILYIPKTADYNLYDRFYEKSTHLKLYVRKVLISDEFDDFLPRYLNFVKGVVDSDDLPLNVNRETLAQNKVLKVMSKKITRKVLEMLKVLSDKGKKKKEGEEEEEPIDDEEVAIEADEGDYLKFWEQYGKSIKLGVIDDKANKNKLVKLLRFITSKSNGTQIGLDEYVERMGDKQKYIYYITGENVEAVEHSPYIEKLKKKDIEVVYMIDPLDEYVVQGVTEYEGNQLQAAHKADLTFDDEEKEALEKLKEDFKPLTTWLSKVYGKKVEKVTIGTRTTDSPAVIVTGAYGWSANMERIMKAQTFADQQKYSYMQGRKTLEINPHHPIIKELKAKTEASPDDKGLEDLANIIYDAATVSSGFSVSDTKEFATRLHKVVSLALGVESEVAGEAGGSKGADADVASSEGHDDL